MSKDKIFFSMSTLMSFTDMDAFTAQKEMGSKLTYFEALNRFIQLAPGFAKKLEQLSAEGEEADFLQFVFDLQDELMKIGATTLVWEAEKIVILAREEGLKKCAEEAFLLGTKISALQEKIRRANTRPQDETDTKPPRPMPVPEAGEKEKPRAAIRPEPFEKLMVLIENFELDDALIMLRSLLDASYGYEIDAALASVYNMLAVFDYDNALSSLRRVLKTIQAVAQSEQKTAKKKILAIDDMPDVLNTVKSVLSGRYTVYGVTNHKAALKFLTGNRADLILLDIEMPDMNGFGMLGIIRRIKAYENTPVLFLTGSVSVENVKKSYVLGANDFIKKPIEASVLLDRIEKHIKKTR